MWNSAVFVLSLSLFGCQAPPGRPSRADAGAGCTKFGENCEVSPGKLGTCVEKSTCEPGASCLVCQSQH